MKLETLYALDKLVDEITRHCTDGNGDSDENIELVQTLDFIITREISRRHANEARGRFSPEDD